MFVLEATGEQKENLKSVTNDTGKHIRVTSADQQLTRSRRKNARALFKGKQ